MTRILVVEDDPGIAPSLEEDLTLEGYGIETVSGRLCGAPARSGST